MSKLLILITIAFILCSKANAQVGIGIATPDKSAQLQVSSTTKGLLIPQLTGRQTNVIVISTSLFL